MIMHCADPPGSSLLDNAVSVKSRVLAQLVSVQVARGGSSISGKGFRCVEEGVHFADFISFFLNIP